MVTAETLCSASIIPFQFHQLLYNLISNALKFSKPNTPPCITINSKVMLGADTEEDYLLDNKEYCYVSVQDNGIGFEPEFSERIFEVFQRLHDKEEYAGTGIGLAIVKKIVENHNGIISAASQVGNGARFDIYIPVEQSFQ